MSENKYAYMIVTKRGNPEVIDCRLPIYWRKLVAASEAEEYGLPAECVVRIAMPQREEG